MGCGSMNSKKGDYAVSSVVSLIFSVSIMITASSAIFFWGSSYLDEMKSEVSADDMSTQFSGIADSVGGLGSGGSKGKHRFEVDAGQGSISMDSSGDRMIISYSLSDHYEFLMKDLDDSDGLFGVDQLRGSSDLLYGKIYRFSNESSNRTLKTPDEEEILNSTNVMFEWPDGEEYTHMLENHTTQWSLFSSEAFARYFNLADGLNYIFRAKNKAGGSVFDRCFHVIEGMKSTEVVSAMIPPSGSSEWRFSSNQSLEGVVRIDLYNETGYFGEPGMNMSLIDQTEFKNDGEEIYHMDLIQLSEAFYAVAYSNKDQNSGVLVTCEIAHDGTIVDPVVDEFVFDDGGDIDRNPSIVHVAGDVYAIAYCGEDVTGQGNGSIITVEITAEGEITRVIKRDTFSNEACYAPDLVASENNGYYILVYRDEAKNGYLASLSISTNGDSITLIDTEKIVDAEDEVCYSPCVLSLSTYYCAVVYRGDNYHGVIQTWRFAIDETVQYMKDSLVYEPNKAYSPDIINIGTNYYAIVYRGTNDDGMLSTVQIGKYNGEIGASVTDSFTFDSQKCYEPSIIHMKSSYYKIVYQGESENGSLITIEIHADGTLDHEVLGWLEFRAEKCQFPRIVLGYNDVYILAYYDTDKIGFVSTVKDEYYGGFENPIARVFVFDLGEVSFEYPSSVGVATTVLENNGVLSIESSDFRVKHDPDISFDVELPDEPVDSWPMYRKDYRNSGITSTSGPLTDTVKWDTSGLGSIQGLSSPIEFGDGQITEGSSPVFAYNRVYLCTDTGIHCLNGETGEEIWSVLSEYSFRKCTPAVHNGRLYAIGDGPSGGSHTLFRLNAYSGEKELELQGNGEETWSPVVYNNRLYYVEYGGGLYSFDLNFENEISKDDWSDFWYKYCMCTPLVYDNKLFVTSNPGKVNCLTLDLEEIRSNSTYGWICRSPVIVDGDLFFGTYYKNRRIVCMDASTGSENWNIELGQSDHVLTTPVIYENKCMFGTSNNAFYCYDIGDQNNPEWTVSTGGMITSSPVVSNGYVYFGCNDNNIYCLDVSDGSEKWRYSTSGSISSTLALANGRLYGVTKSGHLYCFEDPADEEDIDIPTLLMTVNVLRSESEASTSLSGSGRLTITPIADYQRERFRDVYYFKMQMHGDHATEWLDYFVDNHAFVQSLSDSSASTVETPDIGTSQVFFRLSQLLQAVDLGP